MPSTRSQASDTRYKAQLEGIRMQGSVWRRISIAERGAAPGVCLNSRDLPVRRDYQRGQCWAALGQQQLPRAAGGTALTPAQPWHGRSRHGQRLHRSPASPLCGNNPLSPARAGPAATGTPARAAGRGGCAEPASLGLPPRSSAASRGCGNPGRRSPPPAPVTSTTRPSNLSPAIAPRRPALLRF